MRIHKPTRSELNPLETPLQKFLHSLLYHFAYPLLKIHLKLWYGFSVRYNFSSLKKWPQEEGRSGAETSDEQAFQNGFALNASAASNTDTAANTGTATTHPKTSAESPTYKWLPQWKARRELKKFRSSFVVCNHIALLDVAMVGVALWPLHLQILSLAENGRNKIYSPLVRAFGTVFVGDNLIDWRGMVAKQRQALESGECVLIFPEGDLHPYATQLHPFHNGAFRLANLFKVPIICVTLVPTKKICLNRLLGRPGFTAYIGPMVRRDKTLKKRALVEKMQNTAEEILSSNLEKATKKPLESRDEKRIKKKMG